ncbi:amino acid permease [Mycoplasma anatis]|uniref:amino acid permease n=1 Tax=Mycoplasmopsis anatis TaxID=171279 RepID=UPI001C4DE98B|nr:amino acid permease [Mycoplasmopsis anatis]MBW0594650.1 amino acid permease [Mycoplasmopsis anatis]MBW0598166.1 amino acid permease [Mycoplasmopsis anatis]
MNKTKKEPKKLNFIFGMLLVIGSSMGAGIFFKSKSVLDFNNSSVIMSGISWAIASIIIIMMSFSLVGISAKSKGDLSFVGWSKSFNSWMTYQMSKNFAFYINLTLTYFFMPLFALMSIQDGLIAFNISASFNTKFDWLIWMILILIVILYLSFSAGLNIKIANIQNTITLILKLIAVLMSIVVAVVFFFEKKDQINIEILPKYSFDIKNTLHSYTFIPGLGVCLSWAGIFFAYDGFYVSTGIEKDLRKPESTPKILFFGLTVVTIIHLIMAIAMSLNGRGDFKEYLVFLSEKNLSWIFGLINIFIGVGVLGIVNGFCILIPRFVEELIKEKQIPYWHKLINKIDPKKPIIGIIYSLTMIVPIIIISFFVGSLLYPKTADEFFDNYGTGMSNVYNFANLLSDWISLIIFGFIAASCFGYARSLSKNKKWLKIMNYFIVFVIYFAIAANVLSIFIDLSLYIYHYNNLSSIITNKELLNSKINGYIISISTLIIMILIMVVPAIFNKKKQRN